MLPRTTTIDLSTDTPTSKHDEFCYEKNDDSPLIPEDTPTMVPNIQRSSLRGMTTATHALSSFGHNTINRSTQKLHGSFSKNSASIAVIPSEVLLSILSHLTVEELLPTQLVSRRFRQLARTVLLDAFANINRASICNNSPILASNEKVTTTAATSTTSAIRNIPGTLAGADTRTISLYLFSDPHYPPARWHESQTVVFQCITIDRFKEVLLFQPINPSDRSFTILQHTSSLFYRQPHSVRTHQEAARYMETEAGLLRRATRYYSPAIGLNYFDYSTGERNQLASPSSSTSTLPSTTYTSYFRSMGYHASTAPSCYQFRQDSSLDIGYSVLGIKHGAWASSSSISFNQDEIGYHWSMNSRNDYLGDGAERYETDKVEEIMFCLSSTSTAPTAVDLLRDGSRTSNYYGEERREMKKKRVIKVDEMEVIQPLNIHRHRLVKPQHRQVEGIRPKSSRFIQYYCLHHEQHQDQNQQEGLAECQGATNEKESIRVGHKDWWVEYRLVPIDAPICRSCPHHNLDQGGHSHQSKRGGTKVEFLQLQVSLDWILSGFTNGQDTAIGGVNKNA